MYVFATPNAATTGQTSVLSLYIFVNSEVVPWGRGCVSSPYHNGVMQVVPLAKSEAGSRTHAGSRT